MTKEIYGSLPCPLCGNTATLRKHESRKHEGEGRAGRQGGMVGSFYIYCPPLEGKPQCGKVPVRSAKMLAYLEQHGVKPSELQVQATPQQRPAPSPKEPATQTTPPVAKESQPAAQPTTPARGLWARRRARA